MIKINEGKEHKKGFSNYAKTLDLRGELGIRTLDSLVRNTHFPGVRLRPLGQLSNSIQNSFSGLQSK
jgi:hypothetical protein